MPIGQLPIEVDMSNVPQDLFSKSVHKSPSPSPPPLPPKKMEFSSDRAHHGLPNFKAVKPLLPLARETSIRCAFINKNCIVNRDLCECIYLYMR